MMKYPFRPRPLFPSPPFLFGLLSHFSPIHLTGHRGKEERGWGEGVATSGAHATIGSGKAWVLALWHTRPVT